VHDIDLKFGGDGYAAYGNAAEAVANFWLLLPFNNEPATAGNGTHIAFLAPSRRAVDEFHRLALKLGGTDEGVPGVRPYYHEGYYSAYVRDTDGNKLQAFCNETQ